MNNQDTVFDRLAEFKKQGKVDLKSCPHLKYSAFDFRPYQTIGVASLMAMRRYILGDDVGLGKSLQAIAAFAYLKQSDPSRRLIVVCNKSAIYQWASEIRFFVSTRWDLRRILASGKKSLSASDRAYIYASQWDGLILTYSTLRNDYERLVPLFKAEKITLVLDEIQAIKSRSAQVTKVMKELVPLADRVFGLTATIIQNRLEEAYSVFNVLVPGIFGSFTSFRDRYLRTKVIHINRPSRFGGIQRIPIHKVLGVKNIPHFREVIKPYFLGRAAYEVSNELPEVITSNLELDMEKDQLKAYEDAESGVLALPDDFDNFDQKNALSRLTLCQLMANSPGLKGVKSSSVKEEELERMLSDEFYEQKTILFTKYKMQINRLEILLAKYAPLRITGDEDSKQREDARKAFMEDPNRKLILLNMAGSESINLQAAKNLVFFDLPWSYGKYYQTVGRARRMFAKEKTIFVYHLIVKDSIDEYVFDILLKKRNLINQAVPKSPDDLMDSLDFDDDEANFYKDLVVAIKKSKVLRENELLSNTGSLC